MNFQLEIHDETGEPTVVHPVSMEVALNTLQQACYGTAVASGWWNDVKTGEPLQRKKNVPTQLMLMVSELAEAMEGHRKNKMDEHLPHRPSVEVELADCLIRIFDTAAGMGYDITGAVIEKLAYNLKREDHKPVNRANDGGKVY